MTQREKLLPHGSDQGIYDALHSHCIPNGAQLSQRLTFMIIAQRGGSLDQLFVWRSKDDLTDSKPSRATLPRRIEVRGAGLLRSALSCETGGIDLFCVSCDIPVTIGGKGQNNRVGSLTPLVLASMPEIVYHGDTTNTE